MFVEFLTKNDFYNEYITFFSSRFTYSNVELEHDNPDVSTKLISDELYRNKQALDFLLQKRPDPVSPYDIIDVADILNAGSACHGFRRTAVVVSKAKYFEPRSKAEVQAAVYSAFNNYHHVWCDLDPYEREARLHMELVRIQPFEDGNKRTARILTCYNLCKHNRAPIVLTRADTEEYFSCIDRYDVEGLTKLFRRKSEEEFSVMLDLYQKINPDGEFTDDVQVDEEDDSDVIIYKFLRSKKGRQYKNDYTH